MPGHWVLGGTAHAPVSAARRWASRSRGVQGAPPRPPIRRSCWLPAATSRSTPATCSRSRFFGHPGLRLAGPRHGRRKTFSCLSSGLVQVAGFDRHSRRRTSSRSALGNGGFYSNPQVTITVTEAASQFRPRSAAKMHAIVPVAGRNVHLLDVLAAAGGRFPITASRVHHHRASGPRAAHRPSISAPTPR